MFYRDAFIKKYIFYRYDTRTLLTDLNSGELLAADPNDIYSNFLLIQDKNGTSFKSADHHTAIN